MNVTQVHSNARYLASPSVSRARKHSLRLLGISNRGKRHLYLQRHRGQGLLRDHPRLVRWCEQLPADTGRPIAFVFEALLDTTAGFGTPVAIHRAAGPGLAEEARPLGPIEPGEGNEGRTNLEWSIMGLLGTKEKGDYSGACGALYNLLQ
jgi:hypothetical protein